MRTLADAHRHYADAQWLLDEALRNQDELAMQAAAVHATLALVVVTDPTAVMVQAEEGSPTT